MLADPVRDRGGWVFMIPDCQPYDDDNPTRVLRTPRP